MEFATPEEAKKALEADIPVLNDRFTEVHPCSSKSESDAAPSSNNTTASSTAPGASSTSNQDELNKKLDLIRQRQLVQLQELKSKRTGISKYLAILKQYALLWERCKDESRIPHEERLLSVSQKIFADAQDVYRLVKCGVEKVGETPKKEGEEGAEATPSVVDNGERAKLELQKTLDEVNDAVHSTAVSEEINKMSTDIMTRILDETAKEMDIQRNAFSSYRGRGRGRGRARGRGWHYTPRPRVDNSKLTLDLRPNVVYIKEMEGVKEDDLKKALKDCVGVRSVKMVGNEAKVVFERHWQANKVVTNGVRMDDKVLMPVLSKDPYEAPPPMPAAEGANAPANAPPANASVNAPPANASVNALPANASANTPANTPAPSTQAPIQNPQ